VSWVECISNAFFLTTPNDRLPFLLIFMEMRAFQPGTRLAWFSSSSNPVGASVFDPSPD
jgi:hypothetical protein